MSKNFKEFLQSQEPSQQLMEEQKLEELFSKETEVKYWHVLIGNTITTAALNLLTSPINVVHTQMQLSLSHLKNTYTSQQQLKNIMESSLTILQKKKLELVINTQQAMPYQSSIFINYRQALKGVGEQGLLGFYKGYGSGLVHLIFNGQIRYFLISRFYNEQKIIQNLMVSSTAALVDVITNPLMLIQSRMILQNRLPNLSTYPSIKELLIKSKNELYRGSSGHILRNACIFISQLPSIYINNDRINLIYMLASQAIVGYPILTIIRRLHCQTNQPFMLNTQYKGPIDALKTIIRQEGITRLYSGFAGFAIANTFVSLVLYSTQLLGEEQD